MTLFYGSVRLINAPSQLLTRRKKGTLTLDMS